MVKDILWDKISKVHSMKIQSHMTQLLLKLKWQGGGVGGGGSEFEGSNLWI